MQKNFSGRSMIEMLGVLAIIGVLSIGGINAFQLAMKRIKINALKSWLTGMEFGIIENCFYGDFSGCTGTSREAYTKPRNILCRSMGDDYCSSDTTSVYAPLKFFPDIMWAVSIDDENYWRTTFSFQNEKLCEMFFNMDYPQNVYSIHTSNYSCNVNVFNSYQKERGINMCKAAKNKTFIIRFSAQ